MAGGLPPPTPSWRKCQTGKTVSWSRYIPLFSSIRSASKSAHRNLMHCIPLEIVAVIACPHVGLLASKLGGKASTNLGAPQTGHWISPQKPRRNEDALCEITPPAPFGARLRPPGCGDPNPCRNPQWLHSSWYTAYRSVRLNPSGIKGKPTLDRFVQQSTLELFVRYC
jgi:hypothetical protein